MNSIHLLTKLLTSNNATKNAVVLTITTSIFGNTIYSIFNSYQKDTLERNRLIEQDKNIRIVLDKYLEHPDKFQNPLQNRPTLEEEKKKLQLYEQFIPKIITSIVYSINGVSEQEHQRRQNEKYELDRKYDELENKFIEKKISHVESLVKPKNE